MRSVNNIRSSFIDYFHRNGHEIVSSSSLVPHNDPSLMFTNAGMVQFKNIFTGLEKASYSRATTAQKCVRAGGKHNDLDNVGYTARHHTFFEMLGNFSFGEYFKEEAIFFAWNFLVKELSLPPEKLLVTVYHEDEQAASLWKKISGLADHKIIPISSSDNFWSMGDTGPCGPCSEIFYDHGSHIAGGPPGSADEDGDRFVEIWNLVFMQFESLANGERIALPKPSIDTGMGLERISAVLQGVHDNYKIDLFQKLIHASEEESGVKGEGEFAVSHRVIADHLRSCAFLLADGVLPANEGRGYVLRRIMRRAMRHVHLLKVKKPLMHRLVPSLVAEMGEAYPELVRAQSLIMENLELEESRFQRMLARGSVLLKEATEELKAGENLPGEVAFKLYDTYGFPLDLTQDALRARNIGVDVIGFDKCMALQKSEARAHWVGSGEASLESWWFGLREQIGATQFLGYDQEEAQAKVVALVKDGTLLETLSEGEEAILFLDKTPFYAESGGQQGDRGEILLQDTARFQVCDVVKKAGNLYAHIGQVKKGQFALNQQVTAKIDCQRRQKLRAGHSATHLLHEALREILGTHIAQKGSLITADRLRFDFSHNYVIPQQILDQIEDLVNEMILQNDIVDTHLMSLDKAIQSGARALFGEKYGDEVRVVFMGKRSDEGDKPWSIELCGGTHVTRTGEIGSFHIISESSVASGIRRIEAMIGEAARHYLVAKERSLKALAQLLKTSEGEVYKRVLSLQEERKALEKSLAVAKKSLALENQAGDTIKVEYINNVPFMAHISDQMAARDLRSAVDDAKKSLKSGIAVYIALDAGQKASLAVGVTQDLCQTYDAVALVKEGVTALGGNGGGGRRDMAQGGGPRGERAKEAIQAIRQKLLAL